MDDEMGKTDIINAVAKNVPKGGVPVLNLAEGINGFFNALKEYRTIHEIEETKREQIHADKDVRITAIKEQANLLRQALENTYKERAHNFDQFFAMLNEGFEKDNDKEINAALSLIVQQIKESPMKQAVQMIQDMKDPNVQEIEI
jgi:hypothetical protein